MRFLADENIPMAVVKALRDAGIDTASVSELSPGASDMDVLASAQTDDRILLTFDTDFGDLVFNRGARASHGVVLFRMALSNPTDLASEIVGAPRSRDDWSGHFSVIEPGHISYACSLGLI